MTIITDVGQTVTVREITRAFDDYGDATLTAGSSTTTALIVNNTAFPEEVASGILDSNDAIGFFKSTDSSVIKNGNEIYCALGSFKIQEVQPWLIGTTTIHLEAVLKHITEL